MDVSVERRSAVRVTRVSPQVRVVDTSLLVLHEDADRGRARRLVEAFRRDGVLRNPPIVSGVPAGPGGRLVVLDGANRVTALLELGVPHIAAHIVDYGAPEVAVSTWTHYVVGDGPSLRERLEHDAGIAVAPVPTVDEAIRRLRHRDGVAAIVDERGALLVGPDLDVLAHPRGLRELIGQYGETSRCFRIAGGDPADLSAEYGRGTLVVFRPFGKADILQLVTQGERLPAGITRHVIPGRVLHLNIPLAWLQGAEPASAKQARLDEFIEERWRAHGVRYYAESIYLFDE
jgi:hypothetical protein